MWGSTQPGRKKRWRGEEEEEDGLASSDVGATTEWLGAVDDER
jgi:hypothetical protein